jgi:hypothetical protein
MSQGPPPFWIPKALGEKVPPGFSWISSPRTTASCHPLQPYRSGREVNGEPIPTQQVRPKEDGRAGHKGSLRQEDVPIKGEIDQIEIFLNVLPTTEGHMDAADESCMDGLAQGLWQF